MRAFAAFLLLTALLGACARVSISSVRSTPTTSRASLARRRTTRPGPQATSSTRWLPSRSSAAAMRSSVGSLPNTGDARIPLDCRLNSRRILCL